METITITRIEYQLVEVYTKIEIPIDELEEMIKLHDEDDDEIWCDLNTRFCDGDNIIYYAGESSNDWDDWDGKLDEFKTPHNEYSTPMGTIMCIDNNCISFDLDNRIETGNRKTDIHDFSDMTQDILTDYIKKKKRMDTINKIIK